MYPNDRPKTSFGGVHAHNVQKGPYTAPCGACSPACRKILPLANGTAGTVSHRGGTTRVKTRWRIECLGYAALAPCPRNHSNTFCSARPAQPGRESPYPTTPVFGEAVPPDDAPSTVPTTICIYGIEWFGVGKYARLLLPGVFEVPWGPPSGRTYSS